MGLSVSLRDILRKQSRQIARKLCQIGPLQEIEIAESLWMDGVRRNGNGRAITASLGARPITTIRQEISKTNSVWRINNWGFGTELLQPKKSAR
jgi:hypothetical protein